MHPTFRRLCVDVSGLGVAALVLHSPCIAEEEPPRPSGPELRLVWVDLAKVGTATTEDATLAVRDILAPAGLHVSGRTTAPGSSAPVEGARVVLTDFAPNQPVAGRLVGGEARREGSRQPTVWIFPRAVAAALGLDLARRHTWPPVSELLFERALAAVVVHELAHALAGASHRPTGLMSPKLSRAGLLNPRLTLEADIRPAFLEGLARLQAGASDRSPADSRGPEAAAPTQ